MTDPKRYGAYSGYDGQTLEELATKRCGDIRDVARDLLGLHREFAAYRDVVRGSLADAEARCAKACRDGHVFYVNDRVHAYADAAKLAAEAALLRVLDEAGAAMGGSDG